LDNAEGLPDPGAGEDPQVFDMIFEGRSYRPEAEKDL
jgi:hypothetical protein